MKVGIIDYGVGNLGSVARALEELKVLPNLVNRAVDLHHHDCFILPGVGNFSDCMHILNKNGWSISIQEEVFVYNKPVLGICLGMQLLADKGFEGADDQIHGTLGLGLVPGRVEHLAKLGCRLRLPHVGWNSVVTTPAGRQLFNAIPDETDFYFVHSYAFVPDDDNDVLSRTEYGIPLVAAIKRDYVWGTQFHPEKSSRAGVQLLRNFIAGPEC